MAENMKIIMLKNGPRSITSAGVKFMKGKPIPVKAALADLLLAQQKHYFVVATDKDIAAYEEKVKEAAAAAKKVAAEKASK